MSRVYNFSAGPAVLPEDVLREASEEMLDYRGTGMSVMEMSHRSVPSRRSLTRRRRIFGNWQGSRRITRCCFCREGLSLQFAMIPMNLMKNRKADFILTGQWSKKAYKEAGKYGEARVIASSEDQTFSYIPDCSDLGISRMRIMSISVRIIRSMGPSSKNFPIPRERRWWRMCLPVSSPSPWM